MRIDNSKKKTPGGQMQAGGPGGKQPTASGGRRGPVGSPGGPTKGGPTKQAPIRPPGRPVRGPVAGGMPDLGNNPKGGPSRSAVMPVKAGGRPASNKQIKEAQRGLRKAARKATRRAARGANEPRRPTGGLRRATMARSGTGGGAAPAPRGLRRPTRSGTGGSAATASRRPAGRPAAGSPAAKRQAMQRRGRQAVQRVRSRVDRPRRPVGRPTASRRNMRGR